MNSLKPSYLTHLIELYLYCFDYYMFMLMTIL